jgi:hypothetical protein
MTKQEAISEMLKGNKVTHRHFSDDEWVTALSPSVYLFEDGVKVDAGLFWEDRSSSAFESDWEIFSAPVLNT